MKLEGLIFVTGNKSKAEQFTQFIGHPIPHHKIDVDEIQSLDLDEVIHHKAKAAYVSLQKPVLVEDTSLVFDAFKRLPGPLIKWFLQEVGNDGLCKLLGGYSRSAVAHTSWAFFNGQKILTFRNEKRGTITDAPRGKAGFGWDPIFIPEGETKTYAEMNEEEMERSSLRRPVIREIGEFLKGKI